MMRVLWAAQSGRSDRTGVSGGTSEASAVGAESANCSPDSVGVADELSSRGASPAP